MFSALRRPIGLSVHQISRLPPIALAPRRQNLRFLLAYLVEGMEETGSVEHSRRQVQEDLVRVGGEAVSRGLRQLCDDGWLECDYKGRLGVGATYRPGYRLMSDGELATAWRAWGTALYGSVGVLSGWRSTDAFAHRSVGPHGLLVLTVLTQNAQDGLALTRKELRAVLAPLVKRDSVDARVKWLCDRGLIVESDAGAVALTREDWQTDLRSVIGVNDEIAARITATNSRERRARYEALGISEELMALRQLARGKRCAKCGGAADRVDHHPPKAWGGLDRPELTRPICRPCNEAPSMFIRSVAPFGGSVGPIYLSETSDPAAVVRRLFGAHWELLDKAFERRDEFRASRSAAVLLGTYRALDGTGNGIYLLEERRPPESSAPTHRVKRGGRGRPTRQVRFKRVRLGLEVIDRSAIDRDVQRPSPRFRHRLGR